MAIRRAYPVSKAYEYEALKQLTSTRLFRIVSTAGGSIYGELVEVDLAVAPAFHALSYAWGAQRPSVPLYCGGTNLLITQHLAEALHQISTAIDDRIAWLWIDQISINQHDIQEKLEQVKLMRSIYTQAERTLIWLGKADESGSAWTLVEQLHQCTKQADIAANCIAELPFRLYSEKQHHLWDLPGWDDVVWTSLRALLSLSWFSGTWVIQEAVLSQRDPVVMHGSIEYSWDKLGWVASWLRRNGYLRLKHMSTTWQSIDTISNIRRSTSRWSLDALLVATSFKFNATDQRDKIFGMLGICADIEGLSEWPEALLPDYSKSVDEVYASVATYLISKSGSLAILTRSASSSECAAAISSSWVPNWSNLISTEPVRSLSWLEYAKDGGPTVLGFPKHCNASMGEVARAESKQWHQLALRGVQCDTLRTVLHFSEDHSVQSMEEQLIHAWRLTQQLCLDAERLVEAFIEATTAGMGRLAGRSSEQMLKDGLAFLQPDKQETDSQMRSLAPRHDSFLSGEDTSAGEADKFFALARNYCSRRSFWITAAGRLGIGPRKSAEGDIVAILFGSGVPHLLRRESDSWSFLGESYVAGAMSGELIRHVAAETFLLV